MNTIPHIQPQPKSRYRVFRIIKKVYMGCNSETHLQLKSRDNSFKTIAQLRHRLLINFSYWPRPRFYQTGSAWSMDQGSNRKHSAVHNFAPTVTKFCVMWEGQALPHDTKFSNCRCEIVGMRVIFMWSLIPGSSWSGLIKAEPARTVLWYATFP